MTDLFDFGAAPPPARPAPAPPPLPAPPPRQPEPEKRQPDPPICKPARPGRVASFACHCGCQDEIREPVPNDAVVPCWDTKCGGTMHRWHPRTEPPLTNARIWDGWARQR